MTDLATLERAAYTRAPDRLALMIASLWSVALGQFRLQPGQAEPIVPVGAAANRLVAAMAAVFGDPQLRLTRAQHEQLFMLGGKIAQVLQVSEFGAPDFFLRAMGQPGGIPASLLANRAPLLTLDSAIDWPMSFFDMLEPAIAQQLMASLIATSPVGTIEAAVRRDRLLEHAPHLPPAIFPCTPDNLVLLTSAWMNCSYADSPHKHALKPLFNRTLRGMAAQWGFSDLPLPAGRMLRERPVMLVAAEIMHSRHVQYRYFGQYLRQLRTRFELVLLTDENEVDEHVPALFDRVLTVRRGEPDYLQRIYDLICGAGADLIFWPSVGMRHWGPLFANLRLAPIQFTALGHSASTFCETIDYYLLEEGYVSDPDLFGETVVTLPDESLIFERPPAYVAVTPELRPAPQPLRIMLPSNLLKLNPRFLAMLAKVRASTSRVLEFQFLPNSGGLEWAAARRIIQRFVPGAVVHPRLPYDRYLSILSAGDLILSPFPFGGLHSVVDSLRQGISVIAMECPEPHGRTDAMLLRRLGMPEWTIARSESEYVAAAIRIIESDEVRLALGKQALALDIDRTMFGDATTTPRSDVVKAVWWLYCNHEAIGADGRKCWSAAERASALA